jgi:hypothetical protein
MFLFRGKQQVYDSDSESCESEFSELDENFTENGAIALCSPGDKFTRIVRDAPIKDYLPSFVSMFNESPETAIKVLMNCITCTKKC